MSNLAGEWRVAGIDGQSVDQPIGLSLRGTENEFWWDPRCAGMVRRYRIEGPNIFFGSAEQWRTVGKPTLPVCTIGLPIKLKQVFEALDGAKNIKRTENNGILISGEEHSVVLFAQ